MPLKLSLVGTMFLLMSVFCNFTWASHHFCHVALSRKIYRALWHYNMFDFILLMLSTFGYYISNFGQSWNSARGIEKNCDIDKMGVEYCYTALGKLCKGVLLHCQNWCDASNLVIVWSRAVDLSGHEVMVVMSPKPVRHVRTSKKLQWQYVHGTRRTFREPGWIYWLFSTAL